MANMLIRHERVAPPLSRPKRFHEPAGPQERQLISDRGCWDADSLAEIGRWKWLF
jgi:hypothetical protein